MHPIVIAAVCLGLATTAAHAEERRQHDAHEHGHVSMQLVLEGAELGINIEAPGMDIVGFEHAPEDDAEKGRIQQAVGQLENVTAMFALPEKAMCSVTEAHAEHASLAADKDDDHSDHKDEHKHSDHKDDHKDEASNHSAFDAHYDEGLSRRAVRRDEGAIEATRRKAVGTEGFRFKEEDVRDAAR